MSRLATWQQRHLMPAWRWAAILVGFSVPLSVALDNLLLALLLPALAFNARAIWEQLRQNPVARAAGLLFGMLALGACYGVTPWREALSIVGKYLDLALIPLFLLLFADDLARRRAILAFLAAMALTLVLSYLLALHLIAPQHWMSGFASYDRPVIFHSRITQNNMMAFAVFLALLRVRDTSSTRAKIGWGMFAAFGAVNVLFMVDGRTGFLILLALLAWFGWTTLDRILQRRHKVLGLRHAALVLLLPLALAATAYQVSQPVHDRIALTYAEFQAWQPNQQGLDTSTGLRLDFYYNTLQVVAQHPLYGVGTGGFPDAFAKQVQGTAALRTQNPHDEYLMISAQTGLIGLALLLYLFYTIWRNAPRLGSDFAHNAARGLVLAYLVNCALNSALLDHSDGLFFAWMAAALFAPLIPETQRV